ncbi:MAG: hypothetical protein RBU37_24155 [Myxococcota bacterium]|jgi:hypothetical protein|nr:hypothetical protein [Myxococcota bacterium]
MRPGVVLLVAAILAIAPAGCGGRAAEAPPSPANPPQPSEESQAPAAQSLLDIGLPTDLATLQESFGPPDSVERPSPDDPSPWGQWVTWALDDGTTLRALADDYSPTSTDERAGVRLIELQAASESDASYQEQTSTLYGFALNGTSIDEVDRGLPGSRPSMLHERGEFDPGDAYHATVLYEKDDLFTYFFFNEYGSLIAVAQATLYVDGAD